MKEFIRRIDHFRVLSYVINLTLLFYLFRTAIPAFKIPFAIFYIGIIIYSVLKLHGQLLPALKKFSREYLLLLVLASLLVLAFLFSHKLYLTIFKDILNAAILLSLFYIMTLIVATKSELNIFIKNMINLIIVFALVISINGLCNLFNIFGTGKELFSTGIRSHLYNNFLEIDSNFAILPVIFSMIAVFYYLFLTESSRSKVFYNILLIVFSIGIFFSGSRRGLVILAIMLILAAILQVARVIPVKSIFKKAGSVAVVYLLSIIILAVSFWCFTVCTSYSFKNRTLELIGTKNLIDTKTKIAELMHKYIVTLAKSTPFQDVYNTLWTPVFVPKDPESSWGTRLHTTVFPLTGRNVEIVPKEAIGYKMDSTCNGSYYDELDLCESYTMLVNLKAAKNDHYEASVYCFVSNDFDGRAVTFGIASKPIVDKAVTGNVYSYYDLSEKGTWKKLELSFDCTGGEVPIFLFFNKSGVTDFSTLKGYVIFAYPQYEKKTKPDSALSVNCASENYYNTSRFTETENKPAIFSKAGLFISGIHLFGSGFGNLPDTDPIRKWIARLISEDTAYFSYKHDLSSGKIFDKYGEERVLRWVFGFQIFSKEYSLRQKLFGGGFNFLNWYGYYFLGDKTKSDWPHNPFLSVLLYSGILGLSIYLFFLYKVFYYYLKYVKDYPLLSIFFLITFYFAFFSGGSPFDPPIMGFFVILPFFLHSVLAKKNKSTNN
jgi:hypothetical protein